MGRSRPTTSFRPRRNSPASSGSPAPTIREALKRLAAQSLIRSRRGPTGGTFINRPSHEEVSSNLTTAAALLVSLGEFEIPEILEARQELEVLCVRQAAARCTEAELSAMARELEIQRLTSISDEDFCASDVRFHRAIADATHNSVLKFVMFTVIEALQPIENMVVFRVREREVIVRQHDAILSALRVGDAETATHAIREQTAYLRETLRCRTGDASPESRRRGSVRRPATAPSARLTRLSVDIGGTFTDVALEWPGGLTTAKCLTTPEAPEDGVTGGIATTLEDAGIDPRRCSTC